MNSRIAGSTIVAVVITLCAYVPVASAAGVGKVQVTCSDGTGYSVGAPAARGQTTANNAFNAVNPLGITCTLA